MGIVCLSSRAAKARVKKLAIRLPTLALAVDDALLAFVERCVDVLKAPVHPSLRPESTEVSIILFCAPIASSRMCSHVQPR